ncbi:uncharacterized protein LOC129928276 [Biomphalaria glabrata]|uniref:Uncharacterized protein LOC129928276 n=1 Tax=Biomphalaria glabrata TaxID=6526 RepID=A0A9W3BEQ6_BIOGL|nr:uncharacterized protein LOC129928276 [Biomphalaria glabrata]
MAVALATTCSSFNFVENLQDWPDLRQACSQHGNKSKSNALSVDNTLSSSIHRHKLSKVLHEFEYLSSKISIPESGNKVEIIQQYVVAAAEETLLSSTSSGVEINNNSQSKDSHTKLNDLDLNQTCLDSHGDDSPNELQTATELSSERCKTNKSKLKSRKRITKIRVKSTKRWRSLDLNEFGFHISRIPKVFSSNEKMDNTLGGVTGLSTCCLDNSESIENSQNSNDMENSPPSFQQDNVTKENMDDVFFFRCLGVDVMTEPDDIDSSKTSNQSPNMLHHSRTKAQTMCNSEGNQQLEDSYYPPVNFTSYKGKCNKFRLYDLECSSSSKVYIRPDKHRRIEKAHKAVKSKNSKSLFNNQGRKTLYMHHRLVKLYNLDLDFRHAAKSQRVPAMPKRVIDVRVASQVNRALASGIISHTDHAAPVQNLKHALHETNAPNHMDMDLATFLITLQHRDLTPEDYDMLLRLDDSVKPKTIPKTILSQLRTEMIGPSGLEPDDETLVLCSVCMEPYIAGQERKFLPCSHYFHSVCIDAWLNNSSMNCPLDGLPVES